MHPDLDQTLAALADPTRRAVIGLLRERPRRSGELAEALSLSRPAMSRHLRILRKAQLVTEQIMQDDARGRIYRLQPEPFGTLRDWLDEVEAFWHDQLDAFKAHAERQHRGRK
ncbi:MAG: metalloregulator ArsR/SmtB family transcription factor [Myxococcota bacterium]